VTNPARSSTAYRLSVSFENCSNGAASSIPQFDVNRVFDDGLARQIVGFYDTFE
jgi:hypothetical protein